MHRWLHATVLAAAVVTTAAMGLPVHATPPDYRSDTRAYNVARGRVIFVDQCLRCHEGGRKGAPVLGDVEDWRARLQQPLDTLIAHATQGHGKMPPRGDLPISDQDVAAAVAYVVERARLIAAEQTATVSDINALPPTAAGPQPADDDAADQAVLHMLLMLFGKERWK